MNLFRSLGKGQMLIKGRNLPALCVVLSICVLVAGLCSFTPGVKAGTGDAPADFKTMDLVISPTQVAIGENVTVRVTVANIGGVTGSHRITLKINGQVEEIKELQLKTNESEDVTFLVARDVADTYKVSINGLSGSFAVLEDVSQPPSLVVVGIIAVVVLVVGLIALWLFRRRVKQT